MAKMVYESENIKALANKIRELAGTNTQYTTYDLADGAQDVYNAGYLEGYDKCTEDMQDNLQAKYDEGYQLGHDAGYKDAFINFVPIFIQNDATAVTAVGYTSVTGKVYDAAEFENASVGDITYNWADEVIVTVSSTLTSVTVTVENKNPVLNVTVCVKASIVGVSATVSNYLSVNVPPLSSNSATATFSRTMGTLDYTTQYLRWSIA